MIIGVALVHNQLRAIWEPKMLEKGKVVAASLCKFDQIGHHFGSMDHHMCFDPLVAYQSSQIKIRLSRACILRFLK